MFACPVYHRIFSYRQRFGHILGVLVSKRFSHYDILVPLLLNKSFTRSNCKLTMQVQICKAFYSVNSPKSSAAVEPDKKKPKKEIKTYITLIGAENNKSITTLDEAKKLSNRRNMNLIKIMDFDPKSGRAVYQLITESEFVKTDSDWEKSKKEEFIKGYKSVSFSSGITDNDLLTKIKMMKKWITKRLEVRVIITGDTKAAENVYQFIEKELGTEGRILQKRIKSDVRFQIIPPKKVESE